MKDSEIFIVNRNCNLEDIEVELAETLTMVEASIILLHNELLESLVCPHQYGFLQILVNQMQTTLQLYRFIYTPKDLDNETKKIFLFNEAIDKNIVQTELTASIHQLQSLCHFAAYKFLDDLDSHTVNSFTVINKNMLRTVKLIDLLSLQT